MSAAARIFMADDDDDFRQGGAAYLREEGFDVVEESDGERVLERLAAAIDGDGDAPDAVVLDFCLPGFSGVGILQVMRRFGRRAPPAVLVTAFPDKNVEVLATRAGAVRVLHKPVEASELATAVREAVASGRR